MTVEHVDITDPYVHEPKGVSAANSGEIYVADGAGSGDWINKKTFSVLPQYGAMATLANATATAMATANTYYQIAGTYTAGTLNGFTFVSNHLTVPTTGVYQITYDILITQSGGADQTYKLSVGINGTAQTFGTPSLTCADTATASGTYRLITPLTAADVIYPMATNTANDAKGFTAIQVIFNVIPLRNT